MCLKSCYKNMIKNQRTVGNNTQGKTKGTDILTIADKQPLNGHLMPSSPAQHGKELFVFGQDISPPHIKIAHITKQQQLLFLTSLVMMRFRTGIEPITFTTTSGCATCYTIVISFKQIQKDKHINTYILKSITISVLIQVGEKNFTFSYASQCNRQKQSSGKAWLCHSVHGSKLFLN